jgi:thiamine transporter ThiT
VVMTVAGLCLFLVVARPTAGRMPVTHWRTAVITSCGVVLAVLAVACAGRCRVGKRAASLFGLASGVLFGLVAGLLKVTTSLPGLAQHPVTILASWTTWALLTIGVAGVVTTQRGYRVARMSASMPVLNVTDVFVALLFGVVVFGEVPAHGAAAVLGELLAGVLVVLGLWRLGSDDTTQQRAATAADSASGSAVRSDIPGHR